jgi:hypothetical protein
MAIVSGSQNEQSKKVNYGERRKRAAAAKRMKNGEPGGWKSLSKVDEVLVDAVARRVTCWPSSSHA